MAIDGPHSTPDKSGDRAIFDDLAKTIGPGPDHVGNGRIDVKNLTQSPERLYRRRVPIAPTKSRILRLTRQPQTVI